MGTEVIWRDEPTGEDSTTPVDSLHPFPVALSDVPRDPALGLLVSQYLPPTAERVLNGKRFHAVMGNGSTFLAPVTAYPTTTATMALYNGSTDQYRCYFIEKVSAFLASGTNGIGGAILACVTQEAQQTKPAAYAGTIISSSSGRGATQAIFANAITITGTQPAWEQLTNFQSTSVGAATVAGQCHISALLEGAFMVPPGYLLAMTFFSGAGTSPLFGFGVSWTEMDVVFQ